MTATTTTTALTTTITTTAFTKNNNNNNNNNNNDKNNSIINNNNRYNYKYSQKNSIIKINNVDNDNNNITTTKTTKWDLQTHKIHVLFGTSFQIRQYAWKIAIINGRRQSISFLLIQNRTSVKYKTDCPEFKEIIKVPFMVGVNNLIGCLQPYKLYSFIRVRSSPSVVVLYSLVYCSSLLIKISGNSLESLFYRRNLSNQSTCSHKWYFLV